MSNGSTQAKKVTLIPGDGIGPEVVDSARQIIEAAGAKIDWQEHEAGAEVFKKGLASGVPQDTIDSVNATRVVLKGPLETPVGFGEKSANVTLRKLFETYANLRPVRELPRVKTAYSGRGIDLVVVRENVEDLYAGIEYQETPGVAVCLKLISEKGSEKINRFAFELARAEGRSSVACATKSNIMKLTEGTFKRVFERVAPDYSDIESWHIIVDNCAHQLVKAPEQFDVIVTTNMNGDILSDLSSGLVGGLGFAPSANIGNGVAIFEAVHGSAPKYAGKNVINPTALILSSVMMLRYLGEFDAANSIENALIVTLEEGKTLTRDIVGDEKAAKTTEFTAEIINNLGKKAESVKVREYKPMQVPEVSGAPDYVKGGERRLVGVDVFVEAGGTPGELGKKLEQVCGDTPLQLKMIDNRGTVVYPETGTDTDNVDLWRCRFIAREDNGKLDEAALLDLARRVGESVPWAELQKLYDYDGEMGYTRAQGED